jgi:hypothetical protein
MHAVVEASYAAHRERLFRLYCEAISIRKVTHIIYINALKHLELHRCNVHGAVIVRRGKPCKQTLEGRPLTREWK